ncbi:MAG TPA: type 4a pilus biogenesis protein PilO [Gaiellaceae bacterium]|nr:type 4a pilus biogenesis protein PilO [Gaiellaceae bacterium]
MKKKLAALDLKFQLIGIAVLLLVVGFAGHLLVVSPQGAQAAKLQKQADDEQLQIARKRAELRKGLHPPTIQVADLFRLARAMPDREDMPGIILTLSQVARAAGVSFDLIEPVASPSPLSATGSYSTLRIHLLFNGDFYSLSDFLYRLRSLVGVRNGTLDATGRLFNVDQVTFNVQGNTFPKIAAEIYVNAYVYSNAPSASTASSATTPTTTTSTTTTAVDPAAAGGAGP